MSPRLVTALQSPKVLRSHQRRLAGIPRLLRTALWLTALAPWPAAVEVNLARPLTRFFPAQAIGGALDGHAQGETAQIYTPTNLRAMAAAGLGEVAYRLRTELGVQAWHLDLHGRWSEPARRQGYWTSASRPAQPSPAVSWGYELPRRGDTIDQAEDTGYSRLDDGSLGTFWKSDPYLDSHFTHEPQARHPQWVLVDLKRPRPVDALRIAWAAPYATRLRVQRYVGGPDAVALAPGRWTDFPHGSFRGHPGTQTLRLADRAIETRFVRILMYASSHTALAESRGTGLHTAPAVPRGGVLHTALVGPSGAAGDPLSAAAASRHPPLGDVRDRLGYAIRELYLGSLRSSGRLQDMLKHAANAGQATIYTSSTDPWHRAVDLNGDYEQPSFQTVIRSGLTRGRPLLVPVPVLYGTPANAVAELRYLRALGVPLRGAELGEEPDGQLVSPEDYGALYVQFARAIRRAFPHLPLGGPGFATSLPDWAYWPDARGDRSWTHRFVSYLRTRHALGLLGFFSFEWYPFDDVCAPAGPQLARASRLLRGVLALQHREGIPRRLPIFVTEYGYSAYAGQDEVGLPGALLDADTVGTLLSDGGHAAYLYGYEPGVPMRESRRCDTWGNLMLLEAGGSPQPLASFWETRMLTHEWTLPGGGPNTLYATRSGAIDRRGDPPVRTYAVRRPDGRLALLVLNFSSSRSYRLALHVRDGRGQVRLSGQAQEWQLSSADYHWRAAGAAGRPSRDSPPVHTSMSSARALADGRTRVLLAPYSITVLLARLR